MHSQFFGSTSIWLIFSCCLFERYYSGEKLAPILTIVIGGNHEASNYLQELPFGGWLAPNIFYLGYAGVVNYKGLRIAGISGIFDKKDFFRGHYESLPYNPRTLRTVYHYRQQEIFRLQQLVTKIDIMMSHDWPTDVHKFGNASELFEQKPHFRDHCRDNELGSPPLFELMKLLRPDYWFSAHLHCKFAAVIPHEDGSTHTKFLGLDKCLPGRQFLQIIEMEGKETDSKELQYDLEWLTILYTTKHLTHVEQCSSYMPTKEDAHCRWDFRPTPDEMDGIRLKFGNNFKIPENFDKTAAPYDPSNGYAILRRSGADTSLTHQNQQTVTFCKILNVDDPLSLVARAAVVRVGSNNRESISEDKTIEPSPTAPHARNVLNYVPQNSPFTACLSKLSYDANIEDIEGYFSGMKITNINLPRNKDDGKNRGFAYVEFAERKDLISAISIPDPTLMNRRFRIKLPNEEKMKRQLEFSD